MVKKAFYVRCDGADGDAVPCQNRRLNLTRAVEPLNTHLRSSASYRRARADEITADTASITDDAYIFRESDTTTPVDSLQDCLACGSRCDEKKSTPGSHPD